MLARALPDPGALPLDASPFVPTTLAPFETPRCGFADLDRVGILAPGALTLVDAAGPATEVLYAWMADATVQGRTVLVADGGNFLDVYHLAAAARRRAAARFPDAPRRDLAAFEEIALERVRLARGFTAYQVQAIVEDILPAEAEAKAEAEGGEIGLLVAPGLLEMYLDDELSRDEARTMASRALSMLRRLAQRLHVPAIVSNSTLSPRSDHPLRILLDEAVDEQVILGGVSARGARQEGMSIRLPRRGVAFFAPGRGRTRLEDFLPPDERATPAAPIPARTPGAWTSNGNRMYGKFGEARRREPAAVLAAREGTA